MPKKKKDRPADYLSPHFRLGEFNCRDGTPVPERAIPALKEHCHKVLEPFRAKHGPTVINSGYRHSAYNRRIGGASNSFHIYDVHPDAPATDIRGSKGSLSQQADTLEALLKGSGGLGRYTSFNHVDRRNYKSRWYGP